MKLSTAFKRAYILMATGVQLYSCDAILAASAGRAPGALLFYRELFTPATTSPEHYWLRGTAMTEAEKHEWRLMALAFAAAMTNAENI